MATGEWEGPVVNIYRTLGLLVLLTIVMMAVTVLFIGTIIDYVLSAVILFMLLFIPALFLYNDHRPMFRDYIYSSWDMDRNSIATSIDLAIRRRGIDVVIDQRKGVVTFPLPPLSIAVAQGRKRAHVYVGPVSAGRPSSVEGLKAFVDAALGKRG